MPEPLSDISSGLARASISAQLRACIIFSPLFCIFSAEFAMEETRLLACLLACLLAVISRFITSNITDDCPLPGVMDDMALLAGVEESG